MSSLSGISTPLASVAYSLAKPGPALATYSAPALTGTSAPGHLLTLLQRLAKGLSKPTSICLGSHVSAADTFALLIKASATVTGYRGHRRTLLPAQD